VGTWFLSIAPVGGLKEKKHVSSQRLTIRIESVRASYPCRREAIKGEEAKKSHPTPQKKEPIRPTEHNHPTQPPTKNKKKTKRKKTNAQQKVGVIDRRLGQDEKDFLLGGGGSICPD